MTLIPMMSFSKIFMTSLPLSRGLHNKKRVYYFILIWYLFSAKAKQKLSSPKFKRARKKTLK